MWDSCDTTNPFGVPTMALNDTYLPDETHAALVAALTALDRDPAHPHPLWDRMVEVLGEVGGIWPVCCLTDQRGNLA